MPFSFIELKLMIFLTKLQNIKNLFFFNVKSFDFVIKKKFHFPFCQKIVLYFLYTRFIHSDLILYFLRDSVVNHACSTFCDISFLCHHCTFQHPNCFIPFKVLRSFGIWYTIMHIYGVTYSCQNPLLFDLTSL